MVCPSGMDSRCTSNSMSQDGIRLPSVDECCRQSHQEAVSYSLLLAHNWYARNSQMHEELVVSYLAKNIKDLAQDFDSKIPDSENLLVLQLERYPFDPRNKWTSHQHPYKLG